ncbi:hypothetical protein ACFQH3_10085 [Haladaptatus sp. GCM10025707]|uniref:DUF7322 domain-containing protein n=1 Tax=unclassified Haladaptatus TaxID=2622732 RepID=UPI00361F353C
MATRRRILFCGRRRTKRVRPEEEDSDAWPDEPTEFDPEKDIGPKIPQVQMPKTDMSDVPDDVFRTFWSLVLTFNIALFALSLGAMLMYFRGQFQTGGAVFALGVVSLVYGVAKYRAFQNR